MIPAKFTARAKRLKACPTVARFYFRKCYRPVVRLAFLRFPAFAARFTGAGGDERLGRSLSDVPFVSWPAETIRPAAAKVPKAIAVVSLG